MLKCTECVQMWKEMCLSPGALKPHVTQGHREVNLRPGRETESQKPLGSCHYPGSAPSLLGDLGGERPGKRVRREALLQRLPTMRGPPCADPGSSVRLPLWFVLAYGFEDEWSCPFSTRPTLEAIFITRSSSILLLSSHHSIVIDYLLSNQDIIPHTALPSVPARIAPDLASCAVPGRSGVNRSGSWRWPQPRHSGEDSVTFTPASPPTVKHVSAIS